MENVLVVLIMALAAIAIIKIFFKKVKKDNNCSCGCMKKNDLD
ncbi:MAG: FeoB-associated Cys-rich membrane protein [Desulfobacterales bacterium]|nr:FeoB-associated Cys-rich membrane protein [Desulfobacterales bacterium]